MALAQTKSNSGKFQKKDKKNDDVLTSVSLSEIVDIKGQSVADLSESVVKEEVPMAAQVSTEAQETFVDVRPIVLEVEQTNVSNDHAEGLPFDLLDKTNLISNEGAGLLGISTVTSDIVTGLYVSNGTVISDIQVPSVTNETDDKLNLLISVLIQELGGGMKSGPEGLAKQLRKLFVKN